MLPDPETLAAVQAMTVQVAFTNALRGLLALEAEADPRASAMRVEFNADGVINVELLGSSMQPLVGYSL